jgi:hypothetical protein
MTQSLRRASGPVLAVAAIFAATMPAYAQNIVVTDAKIASGKLVVTGTSSKPNSTMTLEGQFTATSNTAKTFNFNVLYHPDDCLVELTEAGSSTPVRAVVANCGTRGVNPRGAWNATTKYLADDIVTSLGSSWRAKRDSHNRAPSSSPTFWEQFAAKGDQGAAGPTGAAGSQGATGATGPQGPTGPAGAQGPAGPTGPQGQQGASGVVATYSLTGHPGTSSIAANSNNWVFVGPTVMVTLTAGDRVTGSAGISLGTTSWFAAQFAHSICSQFNGSGSIYSLTNGNSDYEQSDVGGNRTPFVTSLTTNWLNAGTYKVGLCVWNYGGATIDKVEFVNGWIMVTR